MSSFLTKLKKNNNEELEKGFNFGEDRLFWIQTLEKIAYPVLNNLRKNNLKKNMPFEGSDPQRKKFIYFEAFSRVFNGIAPWLELGSDETDEGKTRTKYIRLTLKAISNIVDSNCNDYILFTEPKQTLEDAAFFAQGLLRSKNTIWNNLPLETQSRIIYELKNTRVIAPYENSWLLYTSIIEAALLEFTGECDTERLQYGIFKFRDEWYLGDGEYSDGSIYNTDFINSIVIHPLMIDILRVMKKYTIGGYELLDVELARASRYSAKLERIISPEGTFPLTSRALTYRTGIFHTLSFAAYLNLLPKNIHESQVRAALTKVLENLFTNDQNFDKNGWLTIGINGSQIETAEENIDNGSIYACAFIFLPLGLTNSNPFWINPSEKWTTLKAFNGIPIECDKPIKG